VTGVGPGGRTGAAAGAGEPRWEPSRRTIFRRFGRQLVVTGLGRDAPTVIISTDHDTRTRALVEQYARRMTIEQRLAEIIRAFCADALSSTVNLNVDLDIMLAVLAHTLLAALRARLPGYATATPDTLQRRFPGTRGEIITTGDVITSGSAAAPTHPSCARPTCHPPPRSPGGATAPCATNSPEVAPNQLRGNPR
jgi:hypothetical protein